jgi:hypothetical protein
MPQHLEVDIINQIALGLDEDVYGASGDLSECEIIARLIENIHQATNYQATNGTLPIGEVAQLVRGVWEYMDRQYTEVMAEQARCPACQARWIERAGLASRL